MNQMLHALSYYIVGVIGRVNIGAAFFAFAMIKILIVLLMKLDLRDTATGRARILVSLCTVVPALFAAAVLWTPRLLGVPDLLSDEEQAFWATPCFALHMIWMYYVAKSIAPVPAAEVGGVMLPKKFRTVGYLNIVEFRQREMAAKVRHADQRISLVDVRRRGVPTQTS